MNTSSPRRIRTLRSIQTAAFEVEDEDLADADLVGVGGAMDGLDDGHAFRELSPRPSFTLDNYGDSAFNSGESERSSNTQTELVALSP